MTKLRVIFYVMLMSLVFLSSVLADVPKRLAICDDQDGWPPYLQYQVENGQRTEKLEGYTLDLFRLILDKQGIEFGVEMLPWRRCLQSVEEGRHAMLLNAMLTPERDKLYLATKPIYSLTGVYIYLSAGPTPNITQAADLGKYRICGLHGYDYQPFGLRKDQIDQAAHSFEQLVEKLVFKRCDILIGHYEVMGQRSKNTGSSIFQNPLFSFERIPQMPKVPFVMLISRKTPNAEGLQKLLDQGISKVLNSNDDRRLKKKWDIPSEQ